MQHSGSVQPWLVLLVLCQKPLPLEAFWRPSLTSSGRDRLPHPWVPPTAKTGTVITYLQLFCLLNSECEQPETWDLVLPICAFPSLSIEVMPSKFIDCMNCVTRATSSQLTQPRGQRQQWSASRRGKRLGKEAWIKNSLCSYAGLQTHRGQKTTTSGASAVTVHLGFQRLPLTGLELASEVDNECCLALPSRGAVSTGHYTVSSLNMGS